MPDNARNDTVCQSILHNIWTPGLVLSFLAILVRLLVATRREGIEIDGITYLANARAMLHDWKSINVLHPPLYSLMLVPFSRLWDDPEWGARVVSAILGGLWIWPTLWLARETTGEHVPWAAGLLVALMPAAVDASTRVLPEALYGLCLTIFLVIIVRTLRAGSLGLACFAGIAGGLATLARPEGMGYLFLSGVLVVLAPLLWGGEWTWRRVLTRTLAISVLWLAVLSPYLVAVRYQTGHWHWSGKMGVTLRWAESVGEDRPNAIVERVITETRDEDLPPSLLAYVMTRPREVMRRILINLHLIDKYTLSGLLQSGGIALVCLGLLHMRWRRPPSPPEWFLAAALLPAAGFLFFVVESRYFVPLIPILSIIAALGLARVGRCWGAAPSRRPGPLGMILLGVVLLSFVPWIVRPWFRKDPAAIEKTAGLWLRHSAGPGAILIGRYPVMAYYAEARDIPFARRSLDDLLAQARKTGARFLVVDNVRLPESRPDLLGLVAWDRGRQDMEIVYEVEDPAGRRVVIYRILS